MKCYKCGKDMDNENGDYTIKGIAVTVQLAGEQRTEENIQYANSQLGKYSDMRGGCDVAICYECYIDGLFLVGVRR